jgi:hypothetical protein
MGQFGIGIGFESEWAWDWVQESTYLHVFRFRRKYP